MKISKGTIVRTVMLAIVIINLILKQLGLNIIDVSESEILSVIEMVIEIAVIVVSFWKNNSYTKNAIKADEFLKEIIFQIKNSTVKIRLKPQITEG